MANTRSQALKGNTNASGPHKKRGIVSQLNQKAIGIRDSVLHQVGKLQDRSLGKAVNKAVNTTRNSLNKKYKRK